MEQIQQHEWENEEKIIHGVAVRECKHYPVMSSFPIGKKVIFTTGDKVLHSRHPACITRYPEQNKPDDES